MSHIGFVIFTFVHRHLVRQSGDTILDMYSFPEDDGSMWSELLILGAFFVAFSVIRYLLLRCVQHINR